MCNSTRRNVSMMNMFWCLLGRFVQRSPSSYTLMPKLHRFCCVAKRLGYTKSGRIPECNVSKRRFRTLQQHANEICTGPVPYPFFSSCLQSQTHFGHVLPTLGGGAVRLHKPDPRNSAKINLTRLQPSYSSSPPPTLGCRARSTAGAHVHPLVEAGRFHAPPAPDVVGHTQ